MEHRTFSPKDPFKPSIHYSLRNTFLGRHLSANQPQKLSRLSYPAPGSYHPPLDSPPPRKERYHANPSFAASYEDIPPAAATESPQSQQESLYRSSPVRPLSHISLPPPHSLKSALSLSTAPSSPSTAPPAPIDCLWDETSLISNSTLYFSSHHSDDSILRGSSGIPPSRGSGFNLVQNEEWENATSDSAPMRNVYSPQEHKSSSFTDSTSITTNCDSYTDNQMSASADGSLQSPSPVQLSLTAGGAMQESHTSSSQSLRSTSRERIIPENASSIHYPDNTADERNSVQSKSERNWPPSPPLPFRMASPSSLSENLPGVSPTLPASSPPFNTPLQSEKDGNLTDIIPPWEPSTPSSKTNVDVEIVSTPSGCDDNVMFGLPSYVLAFLLDTFPRQLYLYSLLFLPALYFSRVSRIFIDSQLTVYEIDKCILDEAVERHRFNMPLWRPVKQRRRVDIWSPYDDLESSWQALTDSFMREWNTLNVISGLLLTAIITILQIGNAGKDPLIRHTALLSMICALMSLLFGCMYVIRFGTMQKTYKGAEWAYEADKPRTSIFWNVWVMLAMPAVCLGWAILMFIVCIGSFIWRTGTTFDDDLAPHTPHQVIAARAIVSFILAMGVIYFTLIVSTLREYGDVMDTAWMNRISGWVESVYEHQRMQGVTLLQPRRDVVYLQPAPRPVLHVSPEREPYMEMSAPVMRPQFNYEPPSPPRPMTIFSSPPRPVYTAFNSEPWRTGSPSRRHSFSPDVPRPVLPPQPDPAVSTTTVQSEPVHPLRPISPPLLTGPISPTELDDQTSPTSVPSQSRDTLSQIDAEHQISFETRPSLPHAFQRNIGSDQAILQSASFPARAGVAGQAIDFTGNTVNVIPLSPAMDPNSTSFLEGDQQWPVISEFRGGSASPIVIRPILDVHGIDAPVDTLQAQGRSSTDDDIVQRSTEQGGGASPVEQNGFDGE